MTALASALGTGAAVNFSAVHLVSTRTSWPNLVGALFFGLERSGREVDHDEATLFANVAADVAPAVLLQSELTKHIAYIGRGRFPTPFGRTSNHHSSDSDSPDMLEDRKPRAS